MQDSCYHSKKCNCIKDCSCPAGYECCSEQDNPAKANPTYGHCVEQGTCDRKRGICKSKNQKANSYSNESFVVFSTENYEDDDANTDCKNWENGFIMMTLIIIILLVVIMGFLTKKY